MHPINETTMKIILNKPKTKKEKLLREGIELCSKESKQFVGNYYSAYQMGLLHGTVVASLAHDIILENAQRQKTSKVRKKSKVRSVRE